MFISKTCGQNFASLIHGWMAQANSSYTSYQVLLYPQRDQKTFTSNFSHKLQCEHLTHKPIILDKFATYKQSVDK